VADDGDIYSNVRDPGMLGPLVGQRVIEITQHDREEFDENGESRIYLHFENGWTLSFPIGDAGFTIGEP
jgi:hypothetical protein